LNLVTKAKNIASKVHKDQFDKKGHPYMAHVKDIASRVAHLGEFNQYNTSVRQQFYCGATKLGS
tara:strand:+ start:347 stop:538 length:192 start_codon:yes stop_codon:yes gene_type:complete